MSSWYGSNSVKHHLNILIDKKPKLTELFAIPDFTQQLKSFNPKLLDYISKTNEITQQLIYYLTIPPSFSDHHDRKYKYPLIAVEMVQTETTCVINSFFKQTKETGGFIIDQLFAIVDSLEILPILAAYFFRVNLSLVSARSRETVERAYNVPHFLEKLIKHSQHTPITNTLQLYLNLHIDKTPVFLPQNTNIKINLVKMIIDQISNQSLNKRPNSINIVQNLIGILIETVQKYYLIVDGKQMLDIITGQACIQSMVGLLKQKSQFSYPAINLLISLINYYSSSSLSIQQNLSPELISKNLEKLESQPLVNCLNNYFCIALQRIMSQQLMTLYCYRLLEVLCHLISIPSIKILNTVKKVNFLGCLISLLYKHENCNIVHMLIEKSFLHIFVSQKSIYLEYKKHLFCQIDIIELTANKLLGMFLDEKILKMAQSKGYFGHFMRILKIYSGIQTTDQRIILAIKSKAQVWNQISQLLIKPYDSICSKQLGTYIQFSDPPPQQFNIKNTIENTQPQNSKAIEEIKKEEQIKNIKSLEPSEKDQETNNNPFKNSQRKPDDFSKVSGLLQINDQEDYQKTNSFREFMVKKKVEAEKQIKFQRSISTENRQRSRLTSPSPTKKNSWRQNDQNNQSNSTMNTIRQKKTLNTTLSQRKNNMIPADSGISLDQGIDTLQELKNIRVIQIDKPTEKKYRKIELQDKVLLDFLKISF